VPGLTGRAAYPSHGRMNTPSHDAELVGGRLPQFGMLRFTGVDAERFLQGQLSNDTSRLGAGAPLLAAYSTPQGRVLAVLHLIPHSSGIVALLPREIAQPVLERLRKYVLRSKVAMEDISDEFAVVGLHRTGATSEGSAVLLPDAERRYAEFNGVGAARAAPGSARCWIIGGRRDLAHAGLLDAPDAAPPDRVEHDWRLADIRAGMPQVYAATSELFVAQMLNLDLIDGISFTKGCFTGQEIIARTQHLGRIKRRLFRLRLPEGSWAIGQAVRLTDGRSGRLTELAKMGADFEALAVLNSDTEPRAAAGESDDPQDTLVGAVELPLPYSPRAT